MQHAQCPRCFTALQVRTVAPCHVCGQLPEELEHFKESQHTFAEYEVLPGLRLVLCSFCDVDCGSWDLTRFGVPRTVLRPDRIRLIRRITSPSLGQDNYCPTCGSRLAFLKFLEQARRQMPP